MLQTTGASNTTVTGNGSEDDGCMTGSLEAWPLSDILLWLHGSQKTAMIRIGRGLGAAVLFVREGMLYRCEWGRLGGVAALQALLPIRNQPFSVITRPGPQPMPNINVPTDQLLLALAVQQDHVARRAPMTGTAA